MNTWTTKLLDERGQVMAFAALAMVGLISVVGLVADGGTVFAARRDLQNAADAAAIAGAMQLDIDAYRATGALVLDEAAAQAAAIEYLQAEGDVEYSVRVSPEAVDVSVARNASTTFLRLVGVDDVRLSAQSSASPRHGIAEAGE